MSYDDGYEMPTEYEFGHYDDAADLLRDEFVERVDAGEQCPECYSRGRIECVPVYGTKAFACPCGCLWFDSITRPTAEAA